MSFELGQGPVRVRSKIRVNDGLKHSIVALRNGRHGSLEIDGGRKEHAESRGNLHMLNAKGNIYVGKYISI